MFFTTHALCSSRFFKYETEREKQHKQKTLSTSYKTDIKIVCNPGLVKSRYEQPSLDLAVKVQALAEVMYVVFSARLDVLYSHITRYH